MDPAQAPHATKEQTPPPTTIYSWREYNPNIQIFYLRDHVEANRQLASLGSGPQALGFDLEWRPNFVKGAPENPVALVQLSNSDVIFLLQITQMQEFPEKLKEILLNPLIIKAGVSIQNDAKKLYNDYQVSICNCVELSFLARTVDNDIWKGRYSSPLGLARLIAKYEDRLLPKGKVTRSNWEAFLNQRQIEYAAVDAHAGYVLFKKLEAMIDVAYPPESDWYTFNYVSGNFMNSNGRAWSPQNPRYDPGPPPPPPVPREPKTTVNGQEPGQPSNSQKASADKHNRRRRKNQPNALSIEQGSTANSHEYHSAHRTGPGIIPKVTPHHPYQGYRDSRLQDVDAPESVNPSAPKRRRRNRNRQGKAENDYDAVLGGMMSLAFDPLPAQPGTGGSGSGTVDSIRLGGIMPMAHGSNINDDNGNRPHTNHGNDNTDSTPLGDPALKKKRKNRNRQGRRRGYNVTNSGQEQEGASR
ncbi:hypothetical protein D9613_001654 [Agrocybe pediades]|uniref:3'-5' exonuclease domain-containing protein n=1 Tax=Agrocybe pediades TaxID=84607 RepID=A0A8H4R8N3_9AGAR|nr:hypothetical protein D9613_001654 [Agrocybe pediades]